MRVVGGIAGGIPLEAPKSGTRPTSDLVRGALFAMIETVPGFRWGRVLDLYAGSGALGIEALSRGAEAADFVESDRRAAEVIKRNLKRTAFSDRARVFVMPVSRALQVLRDGYAIILADPPYDDLAVSRLPGEIAGSGLVGSDTLVAVEHSRRVQLEAVTGVLDLLKTRRHGDTSISIFRAAASENGN